MPGAITFAFAVIGVVLAYRDPRRMLPGVLLTLAAGALAAWLIGFALDAATALAGLDEQTQAVVFGLLLFIVPVAAGLFLGAALLTNGLLMLRRESFSLANALSLLAGAGILGVIALGLLSLRLQWLIVAVLLLLLVAPIAYLGTAFVAYLGWSLVYARLARRSAAPAVIVALGAGLTPDGRVTPLLAQRVALGVRMLQKHPGAVLVLSGGKGEDERRSEAEAMFDYALEIGAPRERLLREAASRNTEENLVLSSALVAEAGIRGSFLAVSSDYHAFRAATLLRRLGLPGQAIGARTARYFLRSALLREFLALLRDHLVLNAVVLCVLMLPLAAFVVFALVRLVASG